MPLVGFELTIPLFQRAKTFLAMYCTANVISIIIITITVIVKVKLSL
jgi:hypothetical protein